MCGDFHGQFYDMMRIFEGCGGPSEYGYLVIGDYVDRGKNSLEVVCYLMASKVRYPESFFLVRGNHESTQVSKLYGFYDECKRRYSANLWKDFTSMFNYLPVAAIIEERILCMHGGLSPVMLQKERMKADENGINIINSKIKRPAEVDERGLICDLLWSDPSDNKKQEEWQPNDRGVSFTFGQPIIKKYLEDNDLDMICRAHQVVENGYHFYGDRRLVTIFSAPNYMGEFDNDAGVLAID